MYELNGWIFARRRHSRRHSRATFEILEHYWLLVVYNITLYGTSMELVVYTQGMYRYTKVAPHRGLVIHQH